MYCCQHIRRNGFTGLSVFVRKRDYIFFSYRKGRNSIAKENGCVCRTVEGVLKLKISPYSRALHCASWTLLEEKTLRVIRKKCIFYFPFCWEYGQWLWVKTFAYVTCCTGL